MKWGEEMIVRLEDIKNNGIVMKEELVHIHHIHESLEQMNLKNTDNLSALNRIATAMESISITQQAILEKMPGKI